VSLALADVDFPPELVARAARVKLFLTDVDGCWTDGTVRVHGDGGESVQFHIHDGYAVVQALRAGLEIAIVSGRATDAVRHRARRLGVQEVWLGVEDKHEVARALLAARGLAPEQVAAIGDDLPDLPLFEHAGLRIAPPGAVAAIRSRADWITHAPGGGGALREACALLLSARTAPAAAGRAS
jgi:3-deoxy-D-manno-octulosonate 8-phosphate phosphatase (KDO 8-P phosphatase)